MYQVFISGYHLADVSHGKPYYVYAVEVVRSDNNARYLVEKRYSEFSALHRRLKKESNTAPFPPKRVRNSQLKVLEQRRVALEAYMQTMLRLSSTKQQVLNFLGIEDRTSNMNKRVHKEMNGADGIQVYSNSIGHHPVLTFQCDPYIQANRNTSLPDIVTNGVLLGIYKS